MGTRPFHLHDGKQGAALAVRITPRARRNEIYAILDDGTVKIHLTAPPVEGKANSELIKFLAKVLDVPIKHVEIVAGTGRRDKIISVLNLDASLLHQKILENLGK
jgi:uncharacterized protein (TIGR00251 family)